MIGSNRPANADGRSVAARAALKLQRWPAAWHRTRDQHAEFLRPRGIIEEAVANEMHEVIEFGGC